MQHKSRSYLSTKAPVYIPVGTQVFFHAHARNPSHSIHLCRGYIFRQPTQNSPIYKVVVTAINKTNPLEINSSGLLGMILPKKSQEIFREVSGWAGKLYDLNNWLEVEKKEYERIQRSLKRKVNG